MIRCILFDNDGVVGNTAEPFSAWYSRTMNVPIEKMLPFFEGPFEECLVGNADLKAELEEWLSQWRWHKGVEEFLQLWFSRERTVNNHIIALIRELRAQGIVCCMATTQEKYRLEYMRNEMGYAELFDQIYCSAEIGFQKSDARFFEAVYTDIHRQSGFTKDEILFVDDSKKNVTVAAAFGIHAHQYSDYTTFEEVLEKMKIKN